MSNQESDSYTVVSKNSRVKFFVEKHHDSDTLFDTASSEKQTNDSLKNKFQANSSIDKLTSLFHIDNSCGK